MKNDFYIFGIHSVEEVINNNLNKIEKIYFSENLLNSNNKLKSLHNLARIKKIPFSFINEDRLNEYSDNSNHQGVVLLIRSFDYLTLDNYLNNIKDIIDKRCLLILDNIQDTHNMGAIIRSATAMGVDAIIIEKYSSAPLNGTVHKTSAGTLGKIPIISVNNLSMCIDKLKKNKFWIYALDINSENKLSKSLWEERFDDKVVIIVGNEEKGISKNIIDNSDIIINIPMENNVESLNVSVSCAIAIYEWKRQYNKN